MYNVNADMIQDIFLKKPYLAWFVKDKKKLSQESTLEQIFNYGNWQDYLKAEEDLGIKEVRSIFERLKNRKRTNLRPKTINYFSLYFTKYA
ncbi:MAG: hypothetical protein UU93_C0005G0030 [Candidatus Amesbacteria bacterium GW2011_GWA2_42_12]|uniref:Uncharacterized protein n=1 Tax=Candidatus Amesbacteria bacterium GW2011_GWA2_42_12 TaxID=1618356 RepID=A0A0G0Y7K0_9BACT|nr:MAG: hypothetical protein UU93_C0005G0030 [Candidatus Amesbacteria bacterium GW2011_GWA2_42_12]